MQIVGHISPGLESLIDFIRDSPNGVDHEPLHVTFLKSLTEARLHRDYLYVQAQLHREQ
jgi:hypothetical protein